MSRSRFLTRCIGALLGALLPFTAQAQQALLQGGTWTAGHGLMYGPLNGSQPVVIDSGSAPGGGTVNTGSAGQFAYYPSSTAAVSGSSVLSASGSTVAASGSMTVGSTLSVTGATSLASTLAVSGHLTFEGVTSTGATGTGNLVFSASPTFSGTLGGSNILPLTGLAQAATNTVLGNATSGTANITALAVPSCSTSASAITWTTNTGWGCNTLSSGFVTTFSAGTTGFTPSSATSGAITLAGTLIPANGGTGFASYAVGDLLYADTTTSLAKRAAVAAGQALMSAGTSTAPAYTGSPSFSGSVTAATGLTVSAGGAAITGNSSISSGSFTASGGAFTASPASANVVMSPTGTGVVTIAPATAGTMNNMVIGGSTPLALTCTTCTANTAFRGTDFGSGSSSTVDVTTTGGTQLQVTNTGSAARNVTITGSAAGNPTISTTAGSLAITPAIVGASTISDSVGNVRSIIHSGSDKTTTYALVTTDNGQYISLGASGAITVPNSTFADGNVVSVFNNTASGATITINATTCYIAGTNTNKGGGGTVTLATRGIVTILFTGTTSCLMNGNVS